MRPAADDRAEDGPGPGGAAGVRAGRRRLPVRRVQQRLGRLPGWLFNLEAKPAVEIQAGPILWTAATARVVQPDDPAYPRLWQAVNDNNHGRYNRYQTRTSRKIPVVVVTPASAPAPG